MRAYLLKHNIVKQIISPPSSTFTLLCYLLADEEGCSIWSQLVDLQPTVITLRASPLLLEKSAMQLSFKETWTHVAHEGPNCNIHAKLLAVNQLSFGGNLLE